MNRRGAPLRTVIALALGAVLLGAILFYASTVDGLPPTVVRVGLTQHLSADEAVALTTSSVEVTFSEGVRHASAEAAFAMEPAVTGSFTWSGPTMTFTPDDRLPIDSSFLVTVAAGVLDAAGNDSVAAAEPFAFETVGNPTVVASDPVPGAGAVALDAGIVLTFSTLMDTASVETALRIAPAIGYTVAWSGERLAIQPSAPLAPGRSYEITIGTGARDQAGTPLAPRFDLVFRTAGPGLAVQYVVPADGAQGIAVGTSIAVVVDRELDPDAVEGGALTIEPSVAGSLEVTALPGAAGLRDEARSVLVFEPSGRLQPNTTYRVTLAAGLLATDGARLAAPVSWSFTSGAPSLSLSNQVVFVTDRSGVANLWAMNPDGSNQRQLTAELSPVTEYAVAPDGRSLVVGDGARLVLMDADGGNRRVLTDAGQLEYDVAYAPDGRSIVFGRADAETGSGLGLWTRDASGGRPEDVPLPAVEPTPGAEPSASAPEPVPLLRAPRYSPDGTQLAFVDSAGAVAILHLEEELLDRAPFGAAGPPTWLPDGSAVLISGLPSGDAPAPGPRARAPRVPVPPLDPAALGFDAAQLDALRLVALVPGDAAVEPYRAQPSPARPAVSDGPRLVYVSLDAGDPAGGRLFLLEPGGTLGTELLPTGELREATPAFTPRPNRLLVSRIDPTGRSAGIWLLDLSGASAVRLASDGWAPAWLP